jgi:hypothetical protein
MLRKMRSEGIFTEDGALMTYIPLFSDPISFNFRKLYFGEAEER